MHKLLKISTAFGTAALSLTVFATVAMASETEVVNTGDNVNVAAGTSSSTNVTVTNTNTAVISQSSTSNVNTGDNKASRNIGDTSIDTGSAKVANTFAANANANATTINGVGGGSNDSVSLTNTGDNVNLYGFGGDTTNVTVNNANTAAVEQHAYSDVNTGDNKANRNIGDTSIDTGNAQVSNVFGAQLNSNKTNIKNLHNGHDLNLDITNTGDNLNVGDRCDEGDELNVAVNNANNAVISQSSHSYVNTGGNKANRNIAEDGDVSVTTGNANVSNAFSAAANSNVTGISGHGLFGGSDDDVTITNTGDNLHVAGLGTSVETNIAVTNLNNAVVSQSTCNEVNTGDNRANRNIDLWGAGTSIDSGNAGVAAAFLAAANFNWAGIGGSFAMPTTWWML